MCGMERKRRDYVSSIDTQQGYRRWRLVVAGRYLL